MKYPDLPFTLKDIPSLAELRRQEERLQIDVPAVPLRALLRLMRVGNDVQAAVATQLERRGISLPRFVLLMQLMRAERQRLTPSELAEKAGVTRATVTGLLDGLEKRGWIKRCDHPDDRRSVIVQLTAPGTAFILEILPGHLGYITSLITGLAEPELLHLMETLERVERNLEVDSGA